MGIILLYILRKILRQIKQSMGGEKMDIIISEDVIQYLENLRRRTLTIYTEIIGSC